MARHYGPRISISGRIDPRSAAIAAAFLHKTRGIYSRSDLVCACFDVVAHLAKETTDLEDPEQYEDAFSMLRQLGLVWPGKRAAQDELKALQHDALTDLEPEQIAEFKEFLIDMRAKKATKQAEAEKSPLLKEIEGIE